MKHLHKQSVSSAPSPPPRTPERVFDDQTLLQTRVHKAQSLRWVLQRGSSDDLLSIIRSAFLKSTKLLFSPPVRLCRCQYVTPPVTDFSHFEMKECIYPQSCPPSTRPPPPSTRLLSEQLLHTDRPQTHISPPLPLFPFQTLSKPDCPLIAFFRTHE